MIERIADDKREQFELDLDDLLPWQEASDSAAAVEAESASFFAAQARG